MARLFNMWRYFHLSQWRKKGRKPVERTALQTQVPVIKWWIQSPNVQLSVINSVMNFHMSVQFEFLVLSINVWSIFIGLNDISHNSIVKAVISKLLFKAWSIKFKSTFPLPFDVCLSEFSTEDYGDLLLCVKSFWVFINPHLTCRMLLSKAIYEKPVFYMREIKIDEKCMMRHFQY